MTRDQIELLCRNIQASTGDWKPEESILLRHDAEQRQVIEQLRKELGLLKQDDAERCTLIRDMEEEERRKDAVIEQQQERINELIERKNNFWRDVVEWRGIEFDNVCTECSGSGYKVYGNTTTYHHGAGGQAITTSVCNKCWGSGDTFRPWTSWLKIEQQAQQIATLREALKGIVTNIDEMSDRSLLLVQIRSFAKQALKEVK